MKSGDRRQSFTLIELLIVVSIILLMSSLALINLGEAQTRAKVARTRADLRVLMLGLESYRVDFTHYPPNALIPPAMQQPPPPPQEFAGYPIAPATLTTPLAYLTTTPHDPFRAAGVDVYPYWMDDYRNQLADYTYLRVIDQREWMDLYRADEFVPLMAVQQREPLPPEFPRHFDEAVQRDMLPGFNVAAFQKYGQWALIGAGPDQLFAAWEPDLAVKLFSDGLWHHIAYQSYRTDIEASLWLREPRFGPWGYSFDVPYDPTNGTFSYGNLFLTQLARDAPVPLLDAGPSAGEGLPGVPPPEPTWDGPIVAMGGGGGPSPGDRATPATPPGGDESTTARTTNGARATAPMAGGEPGTGQLTPGGSGAGSAARAGGGSDVLATLLAAAPGRAGATAAPTSGTQLALVLSLDATKTAALLPLPAPLALSPRPRRSSDVARWLGWLLLLLALLLLAWALYRWWTREPSAVAQLEVRLTDQKLAALPGRMELTELDLSHSLVSDEGMAALAGLERLETLNLWDTTVGDAGLARLEGMSSLHTLNLTDCPVSDDGLAPLSWMPALHTLLLGGTQVTDEGLKHLAPIASLRNLTLRGTLVTTAGVAWLRTMLPHCQIVCGLDDAIKPLAPAPQ